MHRKLILKRIREQRRGEERRGEERRGEERTAVESRGKERERYRRDLIIFFITKTRYKFQKVLLLCNRGHDHYYK